MPLPVATIQQALAANGVVVGIHNDAVLQLSQFPTDQPVKVAQGTPPVHGAPATIEHYFRSGGQRAGQPLEMDDGRVDFRELGYIENVTKGLITPLMAPLFTAWGRK